MTRLEAAPEHYLIDGTIINGRKIADEILGELKEKIALYDPKPTIADIIVGEDMASRVYIRMKEKAAEKIGAVIRNIVFPGAVKKEVVLETLRKLNASEDIHGIVVERPLPPHLDYGKILSTITYTKDVEGLHALNLGSLIQNKEALPPATPQGIILLCERLNIRLKGADVAIINHSPTVGRPLAEMFLNRNATVSVCHIFTKNVERFTLKSDIIVVGVGIPDYLKAHMVPKECIVLDVGFNRREDGTSCGDADFEDLKEKVKYITPVPGGVGPMTVASLMKNTVHAFQLQHGKIRRGKKGREREKRS